MTPRSTTDGVWLLDYRSGKLMGTILGMTPFAPLTVDAVEFILQPAVADNSALEAKLAPKLTPLRLLDTKSRVMMGPATSRRSVRSAQPGARSCAR